MHRKIVLLFFLLLSASLFCQIKGRVTETSGKKLSYVNVYTENSSLGTTTNEEGFYELKLNQPGEYTLVFQFLGFETLKKKVEIRDFPYLLNVRLKPETTNLAEIILNSAENPANTIIKKAIAARKENAEKISAYTADYYSKGWWKIENAPEKILGQDVGDLGGGLDSTRSGIVYLSETISKIAYKKPDDFKETIIASKVSGDDNGFSLNSAQESYFSFYNNTVEINSQMISPLADYAFNYYRYKLQGTFYDNNGKLIYKIEVTPKREKDRVFSGNLYIVEELWQIYGLNLQTNGQALQIPPVGELSFKQNFKFSEEYNFYQQISQNVSFSFGIFGVSGNGNFSAVYSNYNFNPGFSKKSFSNEVLSFAPQANKKENDYWKKLRPVPLTKEEFLDYKNKDSIQEKRKSRAYLDSVDAVENAFSPSDILFGYTFSNSFEKYRLSISSPLWGTHFNTVQGWNTSVSLNYHQDTDENERTSWEIFSNFNYGFSEKRFRASGGFQKKFNNITKPILKVSGGLTTAQINNTEPISKRLNDITTIFFERNYLKLYERSFAEVKYSQEIFNGLNAYSHFSYENRQALVNTTRQVIIPNKNVAYTANNPLQPQNFGSLLFEEHHIFKFALTAKIEFGQKYISYPDSKYTIANTKFPTLYLGYENGFGASESHYNFQQFKASIQQTINLGNKGEFVYSLNGGTFLNGDAISFIDYQHFTGNQTRVATASNYLNRFNLMPYYEFSTNKTYGEAHVEQNFKGWVLGKIPFLNRLNFNLILGAHTLATQAKKPYFEYSAGLGNIGFGKYRFFRVDYVLSENNNQHEGAFIFGLNLPFN